MTTPWPSHLSPGQCKLSSILSILIPGKDTMILLDILMTKTGKDESHFTVKISTNIFEVDFINATGNADTDCPILFGKRKARPINSVPAQ